MRKAQCKGLSCRDRDGTVPWLDKQIFHTSFVLSSQGSRWRASSTVTTFTQHRTEKSFSQFCCFRGLASLVLAMVPTAQYFGPKFEQLRVPQDLESIRHFLGTVSTEHENRFCTEKVIVIAVYFSRLTSGKENTLFNYVTFDSFNGVLVCPMSNDPTFRCGAAHTEVLKTFHNTCLTIRRMFLPYYKQVGST